MDPRAQAVRRLLCGMAPSRSIPFIKAFALLPDEELFLIERECRGKSTQQIALERHVSVDTVVRKRKAALAKIAGAMEDIRQPPD